MASHSQRSMPIVFVVSRDWTLRAMVRAELREAHIEALGMETTRDVAEALARGIAPSLIVLDGVELENPAAREALENLARNVLVVDSRTTPAPALPGAEVLRRPLRIQEIVSRVLARLGRELLDHKLR
jgi:DNA-binding response OmpR family regulator